MATLTGSLTLRAQSTLLIAAQQTSQAAVTLRATSGLAADGYTHPSPLRAAAHTITIVRPVTAVLRGTPAGAVRRSA